MLKKIINTYIDYLTFLFLMTAGYMSLFYAPIEKVMGPVQKIFYLHVASAWNAFLAFFVVLVASIYYLKTKNLKWDIIAKISAEIGICFTVIVLLSGSIWGRFAWNRWWVWEPRLTTTLILLFMYFAYFMIRATALDREKGAIFSSVFGILAFSNVPIVFFAVRWWGSLYHPQILTSSGGIHPAMLQALVISVLAFSFLYTCLMLKGVKVEQCKFEIETLKNKLAGRA